MTGLFVIWVSKMKENEYDIRIDGISTRIFYPIKNESKTCGRPFCVYENRPIEAPKVYRIGTVIFCSKKCLLWYLAISEEKLKLQTNL